VLKLPLMNLFTMFRSSGLLESFGVSLSNGESRLSLGRRHSISNSDLLDVQANALLGNYWEERRREERRRFSTADLRNIYLQKFPWISSSWQETNYLPSPHHIRFSWLKSIISNWTFRIYNPSVLEDPKLQFDCRSSSNGGSQSREWDIDAKGSGWGIQVHGIPREERGGTRVMEGGSVPFGHHHRHSCSLRSPALRHSCLRLARRYVMTTTTSVQTPWKHSVPQSAFCSDRCLSLGVVHHSTLDLFITSSSGIRFSACHFQGHEVLFAFLYSTITTFFLATNNFL
jgi:hypothetical protein